MLSLRTWDPLARSLRFASQASHKQKWHGSRTLDAAALRMRYLTLPSQRGVRSYAQLTANPRVGIRRGRDPDQTCKP